MDPVGDSRERCAVAVVGGGAAGLTAAITAARLLRERKPGTRAPVMVFESQERVGRKILATGNGRCNLSHDPLDLSAYHGNDPAFAKPALSGFNLAETLNWFAQIGLCCRTDADGRVFPYSYQASAVLDLLRREAERLMVAVRTGCRITGLAANNSGFILTESGKETIAADRVIITTGGLAAPAFGCAGDGYALLAGLGHRLIEPRPALVQLCTQKEAVRGFSGIRFEGCATLRHAGQVLRRESGEILFTDYGLSGPPILQLSRAVHAATEKTQTGSLCIHLDFLPGLTEGAIYAWLSQRRAQDKQLPLQQLLTGLLHKKIGLALVKQATGLPLGNPLEQLDDRALAELAGLIKDWQTAVTGTRSWTQAQVTAGGASTADFDAQTLMSRRVPGLYAAGEVLDIDGDCGGYNLQWAWSSGRLAGTQAARSLLREPVR